MRRFLNFGRKKSIHFDKQAFYKDKYPIKTEWWLDVSGLPEIRWARLRTFNDKTADACYGEKETIYAFENREYASRMLAEDDYVNFDSIDSEAEREYGITVETMKP